MIYSSGDIEQNKLKLVILGNFFALYTSKNPKNQNFGKMKKFAGDIIILHTCTKNHNHMIYSFWNAEWDWQMFFVILVHFLPFYLPHYWSWISKFWKKMKKMPGDFILLYIMCIILYMVPETEGVTDRNFGHFGRFCALSTPWQPGKSKF